MMAAQLAKYERLRRSQSFQEVYARGRKVNGQHLTLFYLPNQLCCTRMGVTVTKKRFKLSTRRHYIMRLLREAFRLQKPLFLPGFDIVLSAQRFPKGKIDFTGLKAELIHLSDKAKIIPTSHEHKQEQT